MSASVNGLGILAGGKQSRFVEKIFKIGAGKSGGGLSDDFKADVGAEGLASRVNLENFLSSLDVGICRP